MARSKKRMTESFGKDPLPWSGEIANTSFENRKLDNVINAITALHRRGQYLEVQHNMDIPEFEYVNVNNHFQGIQRVKDSDYIILSGASKRSRHAHLFITKIESQKHSNREFIGTNILLKQIPNGDELKEIICISKDDYWHAGGISMCGDILVIPLEGEIKVNGDKTDVSRIIFYNIKNPLSPIQYPKAINRRKQKAGAATIINWKNRFLCAVWTDSDDGKRRFDFYLSKTNNLVNGFKKSKTVSLDKILGRTGRQPRFQTIEFLQQANGELFIIGYLNTRKAAPVINGRNKCYLYKCVLSMAKDNLNISLSQVYVREFDDGGKQYNMGGATGSYVGKGSRFLLYSAHHWKTKRSIKLAEFSGRLDVNKRSIRSIKSAMCECYEHRYFTGRCLLLHSDSILEIESFKKIKVQGKKFNDKLSSLRFQLPKSHKIQFFEHEYFKGKKTEFKGTGKVELIPEFGKQNDKYSSLKILKI